MRILDMHAMSFICSEAFTRSNSMNFTVEMKGRIEVGGLFEKYAAFVKGNEILRAKWRGREAADDLWEAFGAEETERLLAFEEQRLSRIHPRDEVLAEFHPTNARLPLRISRVGDRAWVFSFHHGIASGVNAYRMIGEWLRVYAGGAIVPDALGTFAAARLPEKREGRWRAAAWAALYYGLLNCRTLGRRKLTLNGPASTAAGAPGGGAPTTITRHYTEEQTAAIVKRSQAERLTVTQYLTAALSRGFFQRNPDGEWMSVLVPVDTRSDIAPEHAGLFGDYADIFILAIRRRQDVVAQVRRGFRFIGRRVPYGTAILAALAYPDFERFERCVLEPYERSESSLFTNHSFVCTNVGRRDGALFGGQVARISGSQACEEPTVSFVTLDGRLSVEVCLSARNGQAAAIAEQLEQLLAPDELCRPITTRRYHQG